MIIDYGGSGRDDDGDGGSGNGSDDDSGDNDKCDDDNYHLNHLNFHHGNMIMIEIQKCKYPFFIFNTVIQHWCV